SSSHVNVSKMRLAKPDTCGQSSTLLLLTSMIAVCGMSGDGIQAVELRVVTVVGPNGASWWADRLVSVSTAGPAGSDTSSTLNFFSPESFSTDSRASIGVL